VGEVHLAWLERSGRIVPADAKTTASAMPDCRLIMVASIGGSINLEAPALDTGYLAGCAEVK
jgi:non-heme chloroperoxidase